MSRRLLAPALLAACFTGDALEGEPCRSDADCGPSLACTEGGLCGEFRCDEPLTLELDNLDPDIFLVVDYAATMRFEVEVGTGVTRWDHTRALVQRIADELGDRVNLGLQVVPSVDPTVLSSPDPCFTSDFTGVPPAADRADAVLATLYAGTAKTGEHALSRGLEFAREGLAARPAAGMRPQAIVLISDGPFNCGLDVGDATARIESFDAMLAPRAAALAAAGIPVHVVGVGVPTTTAGAAPGPGLTIDMVDRHLAFEQLAVAGGDPRPGPTAYYTPADADALIQTLAAIPRAFADCRVALARVPDYPPRLAITVDGDTFRRGDCEDGRGWRYVDDAFTHIELCETTCTAFREARALTVESRCPSA